MLQNARYSSYQISRRNKLRHDLQPIGKETQWKSRTAQEEHCHVERLNEDETFLRRIDDGRDDQADRSERDTGDDRKEKTRPGIRWDRHPKKASREDQVNNEP